jgi:excinuclease ABC subunit A
VATVTEIHDYLRLLFARVGTPHCLECDVPLEAHSPTAAARALLSGHPQARGWLCAPLYRRDRDSLFESPREVEAKRAAFVAQGYLRWWADGREISLENPAPLKGAREIDLVLDRVAIGTTARERLVEGFEAAYRLARGRALFRPAAGGEPVLFTRVPGCPRCGAERPGELHPRMFSFNSHQGACPTCDGLGTDWSGTPCPACNGERLRPESLAVKIAGKNIIETTRLTVTEAQRFFSELHLGPSQRIVAHEVLREVQARLGFLEKTGLEYLTLDREASTLSGGEAQRIRLASQIGLGLTGCLYVLDEPTVGLHPRDTERLLASLLGLRDLGNTVVVVEHDLQTIRAADRLIDLGPGAGEHGGEVVYAGPPDKLGNADGRSLTGEFLSGRRAIPLPDSRRRGEPGVAVYGAREHNLKGIDAAFRRGIFTCVTGVSGSGKSTLVLDTLQRALERDLGMATSGAEPGAHRALNRDRKIRKVVTIDQSPIGRSPSSNPATYTGVLDPIRDLFAALPEAQVRGYPKGRFSFNGALGRCATCEGKGAILIEMHFLSDVWVTCEACKGRRYNEETLAVTYRGQTIADVLQMEISTALAFFARHRRIARILQTLVDVGLGYVRLGQSALTLSGGEAQRVKLAAELCHRSQGDTIYLLDEPTTGLHLADVERLVAILRRLAEAGNAVVVIEHNLEVVKVADRVIDLGPEAGDRGGEIVAEGTPEEVARVAASHTGRFLAPVLRASPRAGTGEPGELFRNTGA